MEDSSAVIHKSDVSQMVTVRDTMVPLYKQDPKHKMKPGFLPDEVYAQALSSIVFVCADAMIVNRERQTVYLAVRRHLPMAGLWIIGGRVRPGEGEVVAIRRAFARETGLELEPQRFVPLPLMIRYQWAEREQAPQDTGSDNVAYNFAVELTDSEIARAASGLDAEEYDAAAGLKEFGREELKRLLDAGELAPTIWDLYEAVFKP